MEDRLAPLFAYWKEARNEGEKFGYFTHRIGKDARNSRKYGKCVFNSLSDGADHVHPVRGAGPMTALNCCIRAPDRRLPAVRSFRQPHSLPPTAKAGADRSPEFRQGDQYQFAPSSYKTSREQEGELAGIAT